MRILLTLLLPIVVVVASAQADETSDQPLGGRLRISLETIVQGEQSWDWTQARTAVIPGANPLCITTMSRTAQKGAHGYHDVYTTRSTNDGQNWGEPSVIPSLKRAAQPDGYEVVAGDLWPGWHSRTATLLVTGKTFNFADGVKENILREQVSYAVHDPRTGQWGPMRTMTMPERDNDGKTIIAPNAGCHQRVTLANGNLLLPIRYQTDTKRRVYTSIVALCQYDGSRLEYLKHGTEHTIPRGRGLYEPSVIAYKDKYYLTLRADDGAFVASSENGTDYGKHQPWRFDDGEPLGSYNTQQHWAVIGERLHLIYTRRGADNDHIMRHRAPLFIAEVDPDRLLVLRATEQILVPENNATLGNFGVCHINADEAWVTVAEGRVSLGPRKGERNQVFLVKLKAK